MEVLLNGMQDLMVESQIFQKIQSELMEIDISFIDKMVQF